MYRKLSAVLVCLTGLLFVPRMQAQGSDIAVIVNPNNSATNIKLADLRKVFAGEKRAWPGSNTPIKLVVRAQGSRERAALLRLLGMTESDYKQYWTAQVFRGDADSEPAVIPSFGMALESVRAFPGGICFVDAHDIKPEMFLKVVKVDGHLPGEPGYPLH